jgi:hypothetical protein
MPSTYCDNPESTLHSQFMLFSISPTDSSRTFSSTSYRRDRMVDPNRLAMAIDANIERMDCVNLATLLFHTGKKRLLLTPSFIKRIAARLNHLKEELRAREASNALYGLKCMSSECAGTSLLRLLLHLLLLRLLSFLFLLLRLRLQHHQYKCLLKTHSHSVQSLTSQRFASLFSLLPTKWRVATQN